jgi:hypothetical protein
MVCIALMAIALKGLPQAELVRCRAQDVDPSGEVDE